MAKKRKEKQAKKKSRERHGEQIVIPNRGGDVNLYTAEQAAEILGITSRALRFHCNQGRIGQKVGTLWLISQQELDDFKDQPRRVGNPGKGFFRHRRPGEEPGEDDRVKIVDQLKVGEVVNGVEITHRDLQIAKGRVRGLELRELAKEHGISYPRVQQILGQLEKAIEAKLAVRGKRNKRKR